MSQKLEFYKMHGLGNDFMIFEAIDQTITLESKLIRALSDRHLGIGFDQMLVVEKSHLADFSCKIYNADGSSAKQCGNGMRCIARFIQETGLSNKKNLTIETPGGIISIVVHNYDQIEVTMTKPEIDHTLHTLNIKEYMQPLSYNVINLGNPHIIFRVDSIKSTPVNKITDAITRSSLFPDGVNIGFMEILDKQNLLLRTIERGVGETFACGSNACAAVVVGIANNWLDRQATVQLTHGSLAISWKDAHSPVIMSGSATRVYKGCIAL